MASENGQRFNCRVVAVQEGLVTIEVEDQPDAAAVLTKNEVILICPRGTDQKLKAEVLRIRGNTAEAQVFEETRGVAVGDPVEQTGLMLSAALGPGLLGQVYDGLQSPLETVAVKHGFFLPRGIDLNALDPKATWTFKPAVRAGAKLRAGDIFGTVQEGRYEHKIMIPFGEQGEVEIDWIQAGEFTVDTPIAKIRNERGRERELTMTQRWPVRKPLPENLLSSRYSERLYPNELMVTTQRLIDTFFPIARGGTACIPGPFGAGKTVLQNLISRYSSVDIVIVVACGERAGEVVETIAEFPHLTDPKTGGPLMDRTIIICNTSSMPVAAREASIYLGITLGEYYRQMGYDTLLLADSTSRWAQAMRETSGRMEEIPGEEAFPAYLDSSIKSVYERAGLIKTNDESVGALTMIGTVSPAGGNFEEPVTQSTLATVRCFLGLSSDRAYKRFYPAVDPLRSWSRYREQLAEWFDSEISAGWSERVEFVTDLLHRGDSIQQMMQVTGEEGVTVPDYITYQKALLVDMVYLQQDAFDDVDASSPLERQKQCFEFLYDLVTREYKFDDKEQVRDYFLRLTGLFKNFNYSSEDSPDWAKFLKQMEEMADSVTAIG